MFRLSNLCSSGGVGISQIISLFVNTSIIANSKIYLYNNIITKLLRHLLTLRITKILTVHEDQNNINKKYKSEVKFEKL